MCTILMKFVLRIIVQMMCHSYRLFHASRPLWSGETNPYPASTGYWFGGMPVLASYRRGTCLVIVINNQDKSKNPWLCEIDTILNKEPLFEVATRPQTVGSCYFIQCVRLRPKKHEFHIEKRSPIECSLTGISPSFIPDTRKPSCDLSSTWWYSSLRSADALMDLPARSSFVPHQDMP